MKQKRKRKRRISLPAVVLFCASAVCITLLVHMIYRNNHEPEEAVIIDERQPVTESPAEPASENPALRPETETIEIQQANFGLADIPSGYTAERREENAVHDGLLLRIDEECPFVGANYLTDFQTKNTSYRITAMSLPVQENALKAMNALAEAYVQETGLNNLLVYSTTEPYQAEGAFYPEFLPDRATGYCLDIAFLNEDGTISPIEEGSCPWLTENAWRFGFMFSVPGAAYHIRYVGRLHAFLMKDQNLTLPDYLQALRSFSAQTPYQCIMPDGRKMSVYFVPAAAFGAADIPVPENKTYEISGNNTDGYIIWTSAV